MGGYLERLDEWIQRHWAFLEVSGTVHYSKPSKDGRDKDSAYLVVLGESEDVELLLWESGEAELNYGRLGEVTFQHLDLGLIAELDKLLTRFGELVSTLGTGTAHGHGADAG